MSKEMKYLEIELAIYRCYVVVTWERDLTKIVTWAKKHGIKSMTKQWISQVAEILLESRTQGVCVTLGDDNIDILIWLKQKPKTIEEYGHLYHELHHAVGRISKDHNFKDESEAQAYIYEYLATECNKYLW